MADRVTLDRLKTDLGERSTYDAASQCSRCGYCEQACPTYVATGRESYSPRGRNQLVRLMLEGKLTDPKIAEEALATCLLCGACQTACYAHVATPDIVLEGRRRIAATESTRPFRLLSFLLVKKPSLLRLLLRFGYFAKRLGLSFLARPFLRKAGLEALAVADARVSEAPSRFLEDWLSRRKRSESPNWLYFAACGPNYVLPRVGIATWRVLKELRGPGAWLETGCCGLLPYNYGSVEDARTLARDVIVAAEAAPSAPIVVDCSSCAAFLKSYEQLFLNDSEMRQRATNFVRRVKDVIELINVTVPPPCGGWTVTFHESCRACHGQGLRIPATLLESGSGVKYAPLPDSSDCCGGAGAFAFTQTELSDELLRRKIGRIAQTRAKTVVCSSTSCLLQLADGLRKYYPEAEVVHASEFAALALARKYGTQTGT